MFYHPALLFDYDKFNDQVTQLLHFVDDGDLTPLYEKAKEVYFNNQNETFVLFKYGQPLRLLRTITDIKFSLTKNSEIGYWVTLLLSKYVEPITSVGFNWRNLAAALKLINWSTQEIDMLFNGLPVNLLLQKEPIAKHIEVVRHNDPYWHWVRLSYSYNQGGWLSITDCKRLYNLLQSSKALVLKVQSDGELSQEQELYWKKAVLQGYNDALVMLSIALKENKGLYMTVVWDWDDD